MSPKKKSSGASHERLGKREKHLLSTLFFLREAKPGPLAYSRVERALRLRLHASLLGIDEKREELWRYKRSLLHYLHRKGYVKFMDRFAGIDLSNHPKLQHCFPLVTEKGIEAGRRAARETSENEVVLIAVGRLRTHGAEWATIQEIIDKVWEVSKEKKLFLDRKEFEEYWTKKKLANILIKMGLTPERRYVNKKRKRGYVLNRTGQINT
jgi:hypothetical protein